jgi:hypothetical protein
MTKTDQSVDLSGYQKILFRLQRDADGYPPNDWETLWGKELKSGFFQIDNIPFYVRGISDGDIVAATNQQGEYLFQRVVQPSSNSVMRVIVYEDDAVQPLRDRLKEFGCSTELSNIQRFFAVDIPATVSISKIRTLLDEGEQADRWSYEEASIRHKSGA